MTFYYLGHYYNTETIKPHEKEFIKAHSPAKYREHFGQQDKENITLDKGNHIYQIWYDENSKSKLDPGFRPIYNTNTHNFENDVILKIWRRRDWIDSDFVGVLSWRFKEKTGLGASDLILKNEINFFNPINYQKHEHPYTRQGFGSVLDMVAEADRYKLFPFKLKNYKVNQNIWCNFWIATPQIFDYYCRNFLNPAIEFFKDREEYNLTEQHRGEKHIFALTFFLEGLFSVFKTEYENKKIKI